MRRRVNSKHVLNQSVVRRIQVLQPAIKNKIMKKRIVPLAALLFLFFIACDTEPASTTHGTAKNNGKISVSAEDWLIVPGERVGKVLASFTEEDLKKAYGAEKVQRTEVGVGEREMAAATKVFADTKNELIIMWKPEQPFKRIDEVRINGEGTSWKTAQGITNGSTLEALRQANKQAFKVYGFEWEYAGLANDWGSGQLDSTFMVFLLPSNPEAVYPDLLGDAQFSSDHPAMKAAGLKVESMVLKFNRK